MTKKDEVESLRLIVENLRDNHVAHLATDVAKISTDVTWLKQFFWVVAGTSLGGLVTALLNLILK